MNNFKFRFFIVFAFTFTFYNVWSQTLIMNEVSNGISGSGGGAQEYVEFVVVSNAVTYTCTNTTPPCIDIRGWIFDDNSGYHGPSGVASGAVRFSQDALWSCLPLGTIILIYNGADKNPAIPTPDDVSLVDGNCRIIADIGNTTLFEKNSTTPGAAACSYPATGWVAGGTWANTALANSSDCARIVNLAGCEVFSVCYGSADNLNNLIYFSGTGTSNVYFFNGVNPQLQTNWSSGSSAAMQTPGAPNNAANASYIAQFNNGCAPITQPSVTAVSVNAGCTCNGSATANASGSIGGYTYVWYDAGMNPIGQTSATATGLCAGVYNVIATSHIGCTATTSVTITSSSTTSVSVNSQTVCAGTSAILTATPSSAGGTFLWTPGGQTTSSVSIIPGSTTTYSVTYTLAGCSGNNSGTVTVNPLPTVTVNSPTICNGQSATLIANGATSYTWNTGSSVNPLTVSPTSNTTYTVTGTTAGCTNIAISNVLVNVSPTITVNSPTICAGQTATLTANGASTYVWDNGSSTNPLSVSPTTNTNYTITGTTSGCTNTAVSNVVVNSTPTITVNSSTICSGQTTTLTANGSGTYAWNTGSSTNPLIVSPVSNTSYTVIGTTAGCSNTAVSNVVVNSNPIVTVNSPTICNGQTATLIANGASTYAWNTSSSTNPLSVSPGSNTSYTVIGTTVGCTNAAVSNVVVNSTPTITVNSPTICSSQTAVLTANGATSYTWNTGSSLNPLTVSPSANTNYTITGATNGCTNTAVSNVVVNATPTLSVNSLTICSGQTATLTTNGANTYTWNTGSTSNPLSVSPSINTNFTVTGTINGCTNTAISNVVVNATPTLSVNSPTICNGQTATLTANGASTYVWDTGPTTNSLIVSPSTSTNYTVIGINSGCSNSVVSSVTVNPLPLITVTSSTICAGLNATLNANGASSYTWNSGATTFSITDNPATTTTYTVTGDLLGCINSATAAIVINSNLSLSVNTPVICSGQTATLTASGALSYTWSNGSIGNNTVVSPGSTTTYSVIGINGACTGSTIATVSVNPLPLITVNSPTICAGETTTLTTSGANSFTWSTGSVTNLLSVSPTFTNTTYTVTGNSNGCSNTAISTIFVNSLPTITVNSTTICAGETATLIANGASTYTWSNGTSINPLIYSGNSSTSFTVSGTSNNCTNNAISSIAVIPTPTITVNSATLCNGQALTINANGSNTYTWSTGSTNSSINVSPSSNTSFSVTGAVNSCTNMAIATVTVIPLPALTINSPTICAGQTATLTANGANTYTWSTGTTAGSIFVSPLSSSVYTVEGALAGCINTQTTLVTTISSPTLTVNSTSICAGGSATLIASGASTYLWNDGTTTNTISVSPLNSSNYTVTGSMGTCSSMASANVTVTAKPIISVLNQTICEGKTATLTATGALNYTWSNGSVMNPLLVNPVASSTYSVTGFNNGCFGTATVTVIVNDSPNVIFSSDLFSGCAPLCVNFSNFTTVSSGTISSWNWSFGSGSNASNHTPSYCFTDSGSYSVSLTATSSNGCSKTAIINNMIHVFPNPTAEFTSNLPETDILNPIIEFTNLSINANTYHWGFGDTTTSSQINPTHIYNEEGVYSITLTATNQYSCESTTIHDIIVKGIFTFYAPNTFSPNGDNVNDMFLPLGVGWDKDKYQFDIFDRWGENCFSTKEIDKGWDGKANKGAEVAQIGAYTWKVELSDIFGVKHKYIGKVMILK